MIEGSKLAPEAAQMKNLSFVLGLLVSVIFLLPRPTLKSTREHYSIVIDVGQEKIY